MDLCSQSCLASLLAGCLEWQILKHGHHTQSFHVIVRCYKCRNFGYSVVMSQECEHVCECFFTVHRLVSKWCD